MIIFIVGNTPRELYICYLKKIHPHLHEILVCYKYNKYQYIINIINYTYTYIYILYELEKENLEKIYFKVRNAENKAA